jgi:hypothetical protein
MAWSYSGNPADSTLDEVRFLLGDTVETAQSLTDEEIGYLTALNQDDAYRSAAEAADRMAVRFAGMSATTKRVGDLSLSTEYAQTAEHYYRLSEKLMRGRTAFAVGGPFMADDSPGIFSIGMHDTGWTDPRLL